MILKDASVSDVSVTKQRYHMTLHLERCTKEQVVDVMTYLDMDIKITEAEEEK